MINKITNANAYLNGATLMGKLDELELPSIKMKMEEIQALGIYSSIEIPAGLEKMEAKFKWNAIYKENWAAENPMVSTTIVVKSDMKKFGAAGLVIPIPVTVTISGVFKELPLGSVKPSAKSDGHEHVMAVYYLKLEEAGKTIYEVDVFNNIFKIGSVDILTSFRLNQ